MISASAIVEIGVALAIAAAIAYGGHQLANAPPQGMVAPAPPPAIVEVVKPTADFLLDQYLLLFRFPCEGLNGEDNTLIIFTMLWKQGWYIELPWTTDIDPTLCGLSAFPPGRGPDSASLY